MTFKLRKADLDNWQKGERGKGEKKGLGTYIISYTKIFLKNQGRRRKET